MILALVLAAAVATPTSTPVPLTEDQVRTLFAQQAAVAMAKQNVYAAQKAQEAEEAKFQAVLVHAALEQHVDLATHDTVLVETTPGKFAFKVKDAKTAPAPATPAK